MVCAYNFGVLVINKHEFKDHMKTLEKSPQKLAEAELEVNMEK